MFIRKCKFGGKGTGLTACMKELFPIKKPYLLKRGKKLPIDVNGKLTTEVYDEYIQKKWLIDLGIVTNVEDLTIDPSTVEVARIPHKNGNAIYGVRLTYRGYSCSISAYKSLDGGRYDLIWLDKNGALVGYNEDDTSLAGYTIESLYFEKMTIFNTEDVSKFSVALYLSEPASIKMEESIDVLDASNIEHKLLDKQGIVDIQITDLGNNQIKVVESCNGNDGVEGLTVNDFLVVDFATGTAVTGYTVTDNGNGVYTFVGVTGSAVVSIHDNTNNLDVISYTKEYYQSNLVTVVFI